MVYDFGDKFNNKYWDDPSFKGRVNLYIAQSFNNIQLGIPTTELDAEFQDYLTNYEIKRKHEAIQDIIKDL